MFKILPITPTFPYVRSQLLQDIIQNEDYGPIHRVWGCPGHLFVSLEGGKTLMTFDIKPKSLPQTSHNEGLLDYRNLPSPLVDVLVSRLNPRLVYVVLENGAVHAWLFNTGSYTWQQQGSFNLCESNASKITQVVIHERHNAIYWCEETLSGGVAGPDGHRVCRFRIPKLPQDEASLVSSRTTSYITLLQGCPKCRIYVLKTSVLIWPGSPCPPGLFLKWYPVTGALEVHMLGKGLILAEKHVFAALEFRTLVTKLVSVWTQVVPPIVRSPIYNYPLQQLYLLTSDLNVHAISDAADVQLVCKLKSSTSSFSFDANEDEEEKCDLDTSWKWLIFRRILIGISHNSLRCYNLATGALVCAGTEEAASLSESENLGIWQSLTTVETAGFYSPSNIFQLQMRPPKEWGGADTVGLLQGFGKSQLAAHIALQEANKQTQESDIDGAVDTVEVLMKDKVLESPALLVALLQQSQEQGMTPKLHSLLKSMLKQFHMDSPRTTPTKLRQLVGPLLSEYWRLEEQRVDLISGKQDMVLRNRRTVKEEIEYHLSHDNPESNASRLSHIEILSQSYPQQVLTALMDYLGLENEDVILADMGRWKAILTPEPPPGGSTEYKGQGLPLFEVICRLFFKEKPEHLVNFVKIVQVISDQSVGVTAFIRRKQSHMFYDRALACIPNPELSSSPDMAVTATARLIIISGTPHNKVRALQLLLRHKHWDPAITLVEESSDQSSVHCELFHILLTTALREQVMALHCNRILQLVPDKVSVLDLLTLLHSQPGQRDRGAIGNTVGDEIFFGGDSKDMPIGILRRHILRMMNRSS